MKKKELLKTTIMAGVTAGLLLAPCLGRAGRDYSGIAGAAVSAITVAGAALFFQPDGMFEPEIVPFVPVINADVAQVALEVTLLNKLKKTKAKWDPEPAKEYQKAAKKNGGGGGCSGGSQGGEGEGDGVTYDSITQTMNFQVAALTNVGIESVDVGPALSEISTSETREKIFNDLLFLQESDGGSGQTTTGKSSFIKAGSCEAPYSVCLMGTWDDKTQAEIVTRQNENEQWFATAGITHAEWGLKAIQQAIVNDGNGSSGNLSEVNALLASGSSASVQDLSGLIGTGTNTVWAEKIVALMNLELAQRLNQGNMLQGSALTVEAARAIKQTGKIVQ